MVHDWGSSQYAVRVVVPDAGLGALLWYFPFLQFLSFVSAIPYCLTPTPLLCLLHLTFLLFPTCVRYAFHVFHDVTSGSAASTFPTSSYLYCT
ncbi:hypothetical protein EDB92DRAFT_1861116 [Lactarius akahatsu]|uniref:Uncharacterized protein n=1 Tax=Lactarius akahatsu TaxID=416441 RepID=A0AAD4QDN5_9AGAM|nr:hypothetical protein EDB92DRAFT_1861116 [Lactarius akahatsu]